MTSDPIIITPQDAAKELLRRKAARESLIGFTEYTLASYQADLYHHHLAEALERVERGECRRLMVFAPPRTGKSELSTRRFPAYYLARNPNKNIISASYNSEFAAGFGRNVRDIIEGEEFGRLFPQVKIRSDNRSAGEWQLEKGGTYFAVGIGSGTTGRGAHLFLIDDPIKDRKDADSAGNREDQWNWYRDVVYTRLEEAGAIVMTLTRWHFDDLAGRALELQRIGKGQGWEVLSYPAFPEVRQDSNGEFILNDDGTVPGDPLGRKPLESVAPSRFSTEALLDRQDTLGERSWAAMFMQRPMSLEGGMFQRSWFKDVVDTAIPARRNKVRAWDLAASSNGDYTVGTLMSRDPATGVYYIENIKRFRGSSLDVERTILQTAQSDGRGVRIILPQDPGQAGKDQASNYVRKLAGFNAKAVRPSGSKEIRAAAFAAQVEAGHVFLCPGSWREPFLEEADTFPLGTHDDQIDACADAFNALIGPRRAAVLNW